MERRNFIKSILAFLCLGKLSFGKEKSKGHYDNYMNKIKENVIKNWHLNDLVTIKETENILDYKLRVILSHYANNQTKESQEILNDLLTQELTFEIERKVIQTIRNNVGHIAQWDMNTCDGDTIYEKFMTLYDLVKEFADNHQFEYLICPPEVCAIFETNPNFEPIHLGEISPLGLQKAGKLNSITVYKDPLFPTNCIILGNKKGLAFYLDSLYTDNGINIQCDEKLNTPDIIAKNEIKAKINIGTKSIHMKYYEEMLDKNCFGKIKIENFV